MNLRLCLASALAAGGACAIAAPQPSTPDPYLSSVRMHTESQRRDDIEQYLSALPLQANDIAHHEVTTLSDSGAGSLRAAIAAANAVPGIALIEFAPGLEGRISLTSEALWITDSLVIAGPGAYRVSIDGNAQRPVFWISPPTTQHNPDVLIAGLTIQGGLSYSGGGINATSANVTLADCIVRDNNTTNTLSDRNGGGVNLRDGALSIDRCAIVHNSAGTRGGGVALRDGTLSIQDSRIESNFAPRGGGVHAETPGRVLVRRSFIGSNLVSQRGGGLDIIASGAPALLENLTVGNNFASGEVPEDAGSGILFNGSGTLRLSTVSGNLLFNSPRAPASGAGLHLEGAGRLRLESNLIAGNSVLRNADVDVGRSAGTIDAMCNLIRTPEAASLNGYDYRNLQHVDPKLEGLANNGGDTLTFAIAADSPARDAACSYASTDQRGFARMTPLDRNIDIGAYEYGADRIFGDGFES